MERSIEKGDSCNKMRWSFSNHTGTHVDSPLHFVKGGKSVSDFQPQDWFFSKIFLSNIRVKPGYLIAPKDFRGLRDCDLLLIKTGFETKRSKKIYRRNSPGLHPSLADFLKKKCPSIRAIGIDFISISSLSHRALGRQAHRSFLSRNILLIEDMKLGELAVSPQVVVLAPLRVEGADASPCTIYAFK